MIERKMQMFLETCKTKKPPKVRSKVAEAKDSALALLAQRLDYTRQMFQNEQYCFQLGREGSLRL